MAELDRSAPVYSIGIVERLTGLTARQIRYYEKEGLLKPNRTRGNRRLYSPDEVDLLLEIKRLMAGGLNVEGVRAWLASGRRADHLPAGPAGLPAGVPQVGQRAGEQEGERREGEREEEREPVAGRAPTVGGIDHAAVIARLRRGQRLSSLFPVNDQAALVEWLAAGRARVDKQQTPETGPEP